MVAFQYRNFRVPNGLLHGGWRARVYCSWYGSNTFMVLQISITIWCVAWLVWEGMVASMLANLSNSTVTFKHSMLCYMEGGGGVWGN